MEERWASAWPHPAAMTGFIRDRSDGHLSIRQVVTEPDGANDPSITMPSPGSRGQERSTGCRVCAAIFSLGAGVDHILR